jgi:adenylosuccinate lyase
MLQSKRGLFLVKRELENLKEVLKGLASTHRDT